MGYKSERNKRTRQTETYEHLHKFSGPQREAEKEEVDRVKRGQIQGDRRSFDFGDDRVVMYY